MNHTILAIVVIAMSSRLAVAEPTSRVFPTLSTIDARMAFFDRQKEGHTVYLIDPHDLNAVNEAVQALSQPSEVASSCD